MLSWEHIAEAALQPIARWRLDDAATAARFKSLRTRYDEIYRQLTRYERASAADGSPYEWNAWAAHVRKTFTGGVPLGFLGHPVLVHTMVFAHRRGIRAAARRVALVEAAYGDESAGLLLNEDLIGLPTITSHRTLTSANRAHHASHLAMYRLSCRRNFWDAQVLVEWGGGYGDMARVLFRLNPSLTYVIVDLPELLALQYIYLGSIIGEDALQLVDSQAPVFPTGKISLLNASDVSSIADSLRGDAFLSTWALTESPIAAQMLVADCNYFGAEHMLIAATRDSNNAIGPRLLAESGAIQVDVPFLDGSVRNDYWFR